MAGCLPGSVINTKTIQTYRNVNFSTLSYSFYSQKKKKKKTKKKTLHTKKKIKKKKRN